MNGEEKRSECGKLTPLLMWVVVVTLLGAGRSVFGDAIHVAAMYNDDQALYDLIREDPDSVNAKNEDGDTPLHLAAARLHRDALIRLLNANANFEAKDRAGYRPLHLALMNGESDPETAKGRVDAVQILLLQGASPDTTDARGWTAMHHAAARGRYEVLESLRGIGATLDAKDDLGRTPLHIAAQWGQVGVLNWLHANKVDISAKDKQGFTPLHCAAGRAQIDTVKRLLELKASASAVADDGSTMLHILSDADFEEKQTAEDARAIVKILVDHGVKIDAKDKKGRTAAELAKERKHPELAEWIEAAGHK